MMFIMFAECAYDFCSHDFPVIFSSFGTCFPGTLKSARPRCRRVWAAAVRSGTQYLRTVLGDARSEAGRGKRLVFCSLNFYPRYSHISPLLMILCNITKLFIGQSPISIPDTPWCWYIYLHVVHF